MLRVVFEEDWGWGSIGSGGLRGLFEDYEDVYIQSWRPGAMSWGLWRLRDQLCIPVKSDGQVELTNWEMEKNVGWKLNTEPRDDVFL